MSPYETLYGYKVNVPTMVQKQGGLSPNVKEEMEKLNTLSQQFKTNMKQAQERMRYYANTHRRPLEFKEGNMVFLRIPTTRYGALKGVTNTKLSHRYYGPCKVLRHVGKAAY